MIYFKIKELRESKNITIEEMAANLKISVSKYNAIESGSVDLKLSKIFSIAEKLGVDTRDLFYGS